MPVVTVKEIKKRAKLLCDDLESVLNCWQFKNYNVAEAQRELAQLRREYIGLTYSARGFPVSVQPN